jgi:hypothetical protein
MIFTLLVKGLVLDSAGEFGVRGADLGLSDFCIANSQYSM